MRLHNVITYRQVFVVFRPSNISGLFFSFVSTDILGRDCCEKQEISLEVLNQIAELSLIQIWNSISIWFWIEFK